MAPKRAAAAAAKPESSSSGSDDESASGSGSSSSEEEEPQRKEEVRSPLSSHKKNPVAPPVQSSDEEEEDGSGEEEEGDASEEEEEDDSGDEDPKSGGLQTTKGQPLPPPETLPKPTSDESSDGSGSDSESSDESPPSVPAPRPSRAAEPSIKPITTKPMDGPSDPVNQVSSSPSPDQGSLKRKRESAGSPQAAQKRQSFQRVWGLDDELILLNGMAEFRSKNGYAPSSNHEMEAIRELIKDSFRLVVSDNQLLDKIRRLKKKFLTNAARAKNDADPVLSNAHEQEAYAISKKVWGSNKFTSVNGIGNGNASVNSESEGNEEERGNEIGQKSKDDANSTENGSIVKKAHYPFLWETANKMADELPCGVGIKMALEMLDNAKAKALEDKLEKLIMSKTRIHMRRINLSKETVKLLLDSVAKSE